MAKANNIMTVDTRNAEAILVCNLIKLAALTLLLHSAAFAKPYEAQPSPCEVEINARVENSGGILERQKLPKDDGAQGEVLRAYFSALQARDWNAMQALCPHETHELMEEDKADGYHVTLLDGMRKGAPSKIDIIDAWFALLTVAFISYSEPRYNKSC